MPQDSVLGPISFNAFLNDLFLCVQNLDLRNFAADNTVPASCKNINDLCTLESKAEQAIDWFNINHMIAKSDKFQAIVLCKTDSSVSHKFIIYDKNIETTKSVKLLNIEIAHQLRFNQHISTLCPKTTRQLNALSRLRKFMGKEVGNVNPVERPFVFEPGTFHFYYNPLTH